MAEPVGEAGGPPIRPPRSLIFGITITGILNNTLIGPSLPDIVADFGRSDSGAGIIVAAGSLPGVVVAPAIGLAALHSGVRVRRIAEEPGLPGVQQRLAVSA